MKRTQPFILVVFGFIALMNVARNSRFEAFHTVDVLGLSADEVSLDEYERMGT